VVDDVLPPGEVGVARRRRTVLPALVVAQLPLDAVTGAEPAQHRHRQDPVAVLATHIEIGEYVVRDGTANSFPYQYGRSFSLMAANASGEVLRAARRSGSASDRTSVDGTPARRIDLERLGGIQHKSNGRLRCVATHFALQLSRTQLYRSKFAELQRPGPAIHRLRDTRRHDGRGRHQGSKRTARRGSDRLVRTQTWSLSGG